MLDRQPSVWGDDTRRRPKCSVFPELHSRGPRWSGPGGCTALCPQGLSAPVVRGRVSRLSRETCALPSVVTSLGSVRLTVLLCSLSFHPLGL